MKELRINQSQIHCLEQKSEETIFIHLNYGIDLCQHGKNMSERCAECQKLIRSEPRNYRQG
jgi:hypothetical protein